MKFQHFIESTLKEASDIATSYFGKVSGTTKPGDNNQVLTEADIAIGKLLVTKVKEHYPDHNSIDEEAGVIDNNSEYTWVIDPVDGTSNFAAGLPTYGIMLGLLEKDIPVAGGVVLPVFNELYFAEKGEGAFCNGEKIDVTSETNPANTLVAFGLDSHVENPEKTYEETRMLGKVLLNVRNIRSSNSVFDIMQVARGRYSLMFMMSSKIWDNIASHIIIEEAGGSYTDIHGNPVSYGHHLLDPGKNYSICMGSPAIHTKLVDLIRSPSK